jgi:6-phosphogluconolactonase
MYSIAAFCLMLSFALVVQGQNNAGTSLQDEYWMYIGTAAYEGPPSRELLVARFNTKSGELRLEGTAAAAENPGFLAVRPDQQFLYATSEVGEFRGGPTGGVNAFRIDRATGKLHLINQVASLGANPAHITVDRSGRFAIVASYYGGTVSLPIHADGSLGEPTAKIKEIGVGVNPSRQESSHPHSAVFSPDNRFLVTADLGLDKLFAYKFDARTGSLTANSPAFAAAPPGSGPRHLAFSPDGKFVYVVSELTSTVLTYGFDSRTGTLQLL